MLSVVAKLTFTLYMLTYNPSAEEAKLGECLWLSGHQYDLIIERQTMRDHCLKEGGLLL